MKKNIDIDDSILQELKILAVKSNKDLKNFIQDTLKKIVIDSRNRSEDSINIDNNFYLLNENLKIFQKSETERYNYEAENFVMFKDSLGTKKKIIVPEVFISDFFEKNDRVKFEGFLRNDFGSFPPAERIKEFEKLAKKAMIKFNAEILENFQHFINICRKIKDEPIKSNFQTKNTSKENDYKAGVTNHGEGWN